MKKLYSLVASLLVVGSLTAQTSRTLNVSTKKKASSSIFMTKAVNDVTTSSSRSGSRAVGDVISTYEYDFSAAQGWTIGTEGGTSDAWLYDVTGVGPQGSYPYGILASGSGAPFYIFDSDFLCGGDQNAWLLSPVIDLTGHVSVDLQFQQLYAEWGSGQCLVEVTTDGGANWSATEINDEVAGNSATDNPDIVVVRIGDFITGNPATVQVRFRYESGAGNGGDGCDYQWNIDDVKFTEGVPPPTDDMTIDTLWVAHGPSFYDFGTMRSMPVRQSKGDSIYIGAHATNNGSVTADNPMLSIAVTGSAVIGGTMSAGLAEANTSMAAYSKDTLEAAGYVLAKSAGSYTVTASLSHDVADEIEEDNQMSYSVDVTDTILSWGTLDASDADLSSLTDQAQEPVAGKIGNYFFINTTDTVTSAALYLGDNFNDTYTPIGKLMKYILYAGDGTTVLAESTIATPNGTSVGQRPGDWFTLSFGEEVQLTPGYYLLGCEFFLPATGYTTTNSETKPAPLQTFLFDVGTGWTYYSNVFAAAELRLHTKALDCGNPVLSALVSKASCAASTDGEIDLTVLGVSSPMFTWSNGETTEDIVGLATGNYSVEVEYTVGTESCFAVKNVMVSSNADLELSLTSTAENCDKIDGSATVAVTGNTGLVVYEWSNGGFNEAQNDLASGDYSVTVSQGTCDFVASVTVAEGVSDLAVNTTVTAENCGSDGIGMIDVTGGSTPYTYVWSSEETTMNALALVAGNANVEVMDAVGCSVITTVTVGSVTNPLMVSVSSTSITCGASDGTATVAVSGGTTPYTFGWSNNATTDVITALTVNAYAVDVTDAVGCITSDVVLLADASDFSISVSNSADATCGDGHLDVTVYGGSVVQGSSTLNFGWSMEGTDVTSDFTSTGTTSGSTALNAGMYVVSANDGSCTVLKSFTVDEGVQISIDVTGTNVGCIGESNGSASAVAAGGPSSVYQYNWSNTGATDMISGLSANDYIVTVTSGACAETASYTVNDGATVSANISSVDVTCNGDGNGASQVQPTGGAMSYTYVWTGGLTTRVLANLASGDYDVTISDANSCMVTATANISEPLVIGVTLSGVSDVCPGSLAAITSSVSGGSGGNVYAWSNTASTADISVGAGDYILVVTDVNGCNGVSSTKTISEFAGGVVVVTAAGSINTSTNTAQDGSAISVASGGTAPYTYAWSNSTGIPQGSSATLSGEGIGTYTIVVTDANNCKGTASAMINLTGINEVSAVANYSIYPNPNNGTFTLDFVNADNDNYRISVRNVIGQIVSDRSIQIEGNNTEVINLNGVESGVYFVTVKGAKGERTDRVVIK
jgi:hypothetical protein